MNERLFSLTGRRRWLLSRATADFFFLQNRSYPRSSALEWVGNRYRLTQLERQLLHRGVFSQAEALRRHARQCKGSDWQKEWLVVDGHNVQITVESAILGRPILKANDGALRDLAGLSANFRLTEASEMALDAVFEFLEAHRPRKLLFLFDAPMSHSGLLADKYRRRMKSLGLPGESRTAPVPEKEMPYSECVVAGSDQAVLEESSRWLDLAQLVIDAGNMLQLTADFSPVVLSSHTDPFFPGELDLF